MITLRTKIYMFSLFLLFLNAIKSSAASADLSKLTEKMETINLEDQKIVRLCACLKDCKVTEKDVETLNDLREIKKELKNPGRSMTKHSEVYYEIQSSQNPQITISFTLLGCIFILG